ncbi:serine hydrolase domain-containing protein [Flavisolibacter nicotianae]|uniref:serine hydrolase domain-containing protein n=1 Tax=Flavisolibacter nicotianae TaxID=2364882 RepID=UPI000EB3D07D|nr:serine hydrolase [Flavisolibacter nicotianae]
MRFRSKLGFIFLASLFLQLQAVHSQTLYFPDSSWKVKKPEEVKMNATLLDSAVRFAVRNEVKMDTDLRLANIKAYAVNAHEPDYRILGPMRERGKPAGLIIKNGYIVAQWGDVKRVDMTFSATKSYLSTVAGLAVDQKLIRNIDDKVADYVWDGKFEGDHNAKITWRHLLTQSSDWSGCLFDVCDWADRPPRTGGIDDWKARKLNEPGTVFKYNDVRVNLTAYALLQVWRKPLPVVLRELIMDPIGASSTWRWYGYENSFVNMDGQMMQSVSGGGHFGGGLFINTCDHARFGLLFARNGKWKNKQLLSPHWVASVAQPSAANKAYGLLWWTNGDNHLGKRSKSVYAAEGFGGNFVVVDSEHDLVIVARWLEPNKIGELVDLVINAIL